MGTRQSYGESVTMVIIFGHLDPPKPDTETTPFVLKSDFEKKSLETEQALMLLLVPHWSHSDLLKA
jgi:hypothetical protein